MKVLILTALLALVGTALAVPWKACDGVSGKVTVTNVVVPNCDSTTEPCQLKKGTNATVTIEYKLTENVDNIYNHVYGRIAGTDLPFPGFPKSEESACGLGMTCPGTKGDTVSEKVVLPVSTGFPAIKVTAEWKLTSDADGKNVEGCFLAELQIVS